MHRYEIHQANSFLKIFIPFPSHTIYYYLKNSSNTRLYYFLSFSRQTTPKSIHELVERESRQSRNGVARKFFAKRKSVGHALILVARIDWASACRAELTHFKSNRSSDDASSKKRAPFFLRIGKKNGRKEERKKEKTSFYAPRHRFFPRFPAKGISDEKLAVLFKYQWANGCNKQHGCFFPAWNLCQEFRRIIKVRPPSPPPVISGIRNGFAVSASLDETFFFGNYSFLLDDSFFSLCLFFFSLVRSWYISFFVNGCSSNNRWKVRDDRSVSRNRISRFYGWFFFFVYFLILQSSSFSKELCSALNYFRVSLKRNSIFNWIKVCTFFFLQFRLYFSYQIRRSSRLFLLSKQKCGNRKSSITAEQVKVLIQV